MAPKPKDVRVLLPMQLILNCHWLVCVRGEGLTDRSIVLTVCTHVPKHLQFAQINKKFQSYVDKKLIVQRSELIVSKKSIFLRIEPKQLRKTVNNVIYDIAILNMKFKYEMVILPQIVIIQNIFNIKHIKY